MEPNQISPIINSKLPHPPSTKLKLRSISKWRKKKDGVSEKVELKCKLGEYSKNI